MKILLISPKAAYLGLNPEFKNFINKNPNHLSYIKDYWDGFNPSLLAIAALTPPDVNISLIDENYSEIDYSKNFDLVGISMMTQQAERGYDIANKYRKKKIPVILGGVHPTILPQESIKNADSVVIGEAEDIWKDLLLDVQNNKLKTFYKSSEPTSLQDAPMPRYELLNSNYNKGFFIQTSRGCNHDCEFCVSSKIFGKKYRSKSISQIINEVTYIKQHFKNPKILFSSDNLFVNKKKTKELIRALIPLKVTWRAVSDISIAYDDEMLKLLKESGCTTIFIGFESINEKNLQNLDKSNFKLKQLKNYSSAIKNIQSYGIGVMASFILGFDNDNKNTFIEISDFIINNRIASSNITILTPFPGTRLRERLEKDNRILDTPWSNYTLWDTNISHPILSKEDLNAGILSIYNDINSKEVNEIKIKHFKEIFKEMHRK